MQALVRLLFVLADACLRRGVARACWSQCCVHRTNSVGPFQGGETIVRKGIAPLHSSHKNYRKGLLTKTKTSINQPPRSVSRKFNPKCLDPAVNGPLVLTFAMQLYLKNGTLAAT